MNEANNESAIRVFILVQHRLLRDVLSRAFRKQADLLVVGCTGQEDCAQQRLPASQCHVLLMDSFDYRWLPASLRLQVGDFPALKCVLTSMEENTDQFLAAVCGGATGYLLKEASTSEVVYAVRATFRGVAVCSPKLCAALFQRLSETATSDEAPACAQRQAFTCRQQR